MCPVPVDQAAYSYLLGMYLGDGHLTHFPRTLRLQIYLDSRYPAIIGECVRAVRRRDAAQPRDGLPPFVPTTWSM